jgi:hypothetical protein
MAERKLSKSELKLKQGNPKKFDELQKMRAKRGRGSLTSKTIRDAGQGKGKTAITAMEKRANQAGKKAERQALRKGASPAKAKKAGKKAAGAVVSSSNIKTAVNLVGFTPLGKFAKAVKGVRSLIKGGSKSKTPPTKGGSKSKTSKSPTTTTKQRAKKAMEGAPSQSKTPFRSRPGNKNKSQKALESKTPPTKGGSKSKTPPKSSGLRGKPIPYKDGLTKTQKAALVASGVAIPTYLATRGKDGKNIKEGFNPKKPTKKVDTPTGKMSASAARKLDSQTSDEVGAKRMKPVKKPDLSFRPDKDAPSGTVSKKSTTTYTPRKKYERGIDTYDTPFGKIKADSSDDAFDFSVQEKDGGYLKKDIMAKKMKKGGKVTYRKAGGKIGRGCGVAMRGAGKVMKA